MSRPGVDFSIVDTPVAKSTPTDTGTGFLVGVTERGSTEANLLLTFQQFVDTYGSRLSYSNVYDAAECFFQEGGSRLYIARVIGPDPVYSSANIWDASGSTAPGDVALVATAIEYGSWADDLSVEIEAGGGGGTFVVVVADSDGELERSEDLADRAAAVTWAESSSYIRFTLGASAEDPRVQGPTNLSGGDDDYANITIDETTAALDAFDRDLGPGQVFAPGDTTSDTHEALLDHAASNNRRALLDATDTSNTTTLTSAATSLSGLDNSRYGALWGNWPIINGLTSGTTRTVPPSGVIAGMIARSDVAGNPGQAVAGVHVLPKTVIDLSNSFTAEQGETLNDAAVNIFRSINDTIQNYGYRSLADKDALPSWWQFSASRVVMAVTAQTKAVLDRYVFSQIDGKRLKLAEIEGAVKTSAVDPYYSIGALYGETAADAYSVDATSVAANTDQDIANGEISVIIAIKASPFAEYITFTVNNSAITA